MNYVNTNQKKAEVAVLTTDKDFRKRNIISHKEGHRGMIKGLILQKDTTILNAYAPYNRTSRYMKQKLKRETDKSTTIVEDFTILLEGTEQVQSTLVRSQET